MEKVNCYKLKGKTVLLCVYHALMHYDKIQFVQAGEPNSDCKLCHELGVPR